MAQAEPDLIAVADADPELPTITLLGGFSIAVGTRAIDAPSWRLRKAGHILKLLALMPRRQLPREQVIEVLWPNLDGDAAANNLRVTLHFARKLLEAADGFGPGVVQWRGDQLVLFPDRKVRVDVDQFDIAADVALRSLDPLAIELALGLYGGELLPEDRFEDWVIERRESLASTHLALLHSLARVREERGELAEAIESLRQALQHDPISEPASAALMRLYARSNRRAQALRQYQQLREALQRELDVEPEPDTTRLYESILTGTLDAGHSPVPARLASLPTPAPARTRAATLHPLPRETRSNLPAQLTSFIGREPDIAAAR
ncbi:MAG TPA: BTAD domain-containing putative transcriptional regulator, partial [Thermomicrobiales bacterium]|nr:BTAD domain-containing putative transcriptional regulator [Thermomicrobiales bacterium]